MTDYKNICSKFQSLLLSLDQNKIMLAIINLLGGGSVAVSASFVFYHLLESYVDFLSNQSKLAKRYGGYMVKTVANLNEDTGLSVNKIRNALKKLKEYGFIDTKTRGTNNHTTIKLNVESISLIEKAYEKFKMERDKKIEARKCEEEYCEAN